MEKRSSLKCLLEYAGNYKYLSIASWVLSVISAWIALVPFYYIWRIIKEVLEVQPHFENAKNISQYGWYAVIFALLSMFIYICGLMCSHIAAFRVQANMKIAVMKHIITLPMGYLEHQGSGKIRKIVNESSESTETYLAHQLPDRYGALATPVGLLVLLVVFDWRLGLLSLIPIILAFIIMGLMTGKRMKEKMGQYQNALEGMSNEAVEYVRGIPVVKTFGQSVFSFKRFKETIDKYEKWVILYTKELRIPMVLYTTCINSVFAMLIACTFIFNGENSSTFLLNLIFYIIITPIITVTLNKIMFSSENEMIVEDAINRIDSILEVKPLKESTENLHPKDSSIIFKDVNFKYNESSKEVLKNINLEIKSGEHVAFVGPSGGGKTTLASLIARFYDVNSGSILIGEVDVKDISSKELMENVSFVFQDSQLQKMSILDNIKMSKKDATNEEIMKAIKDARCEDIIDKLPQGINTIIGSEGTYVSGGEAQRLSIARAMLKSAPILILDEATAFADPDNELKVQEAFANLSQGKTVIMIAHRLSTITNADKIFVLNDGEIVQSGKHKQMVETKGLYAEMWKQYNQSVKWNVGGTKNEN